MGEGLRPQPVLIVVGCWDPSCMESRAQQGLILFIIRLLKRTPNPTCVTDSGREAGNRRGSDFHNSSNADTRAKALLPRRASERPFNKTQLARSLDRPWQAMSKRLLSCTLERGRCHRHCSPLFLTLRKPLR